MKRTICLLMSLGGCLMGVVGAEGEQYRSKDGAFTLMPPKGWRLVEGEKNQPLVTFHGPQDPQWNVAFVVTKEKVLTGLTATDYTRESEKTLKKMLPDFKVLSRKSLTLDKQKARDILYTHTVQLPTRQPLTVTVRAYAVIYEGYAYNFVFRAPAQVYEKYVKEFESMVLSVKWVREEEKKKEKKEEKK